MKTLLDNQYQKIIFHEDNGIFEQRFKEASSQIFGLEYIREVSLFGSMIEKNQPEGKPFSKLIINTLEGGPTMEPEVQKFMHEKFYPILLQLGIKHKAYCFGADIIAKLSIELTADNDPKQQFNYKFFSSLEDGLNWLKSIP